MPVTPRSPEIISEDTPFSEFDSEGNGVRGVLNRHENDITDLQADYTVKTDEISGLQTQVDVAHNEDGTHKNDSVSQSNIATITKQINPNNIMIDGLVASLENISLAATTTDKVAFLFRVPSDYVSGDFDVKATVITSSTTGNIRLEQWVYRYRIGSSASPISTGTLASGLGPPPSSTPWAYTYTISSAQFQTGDVISVLFKRTGDHADDTNTGSFTILACWAEYTGRVS